MSTAYTDERDVVVAAQGVYAPQDDSRVLIDVLEKTGLAIGRRIADLCTGSGVVAITAAQQGAAEVTAFDICARAVRCARVNAVCAGVHVDVHLGSWARAVEFAPFDLVVCNPPYVPHDPGVNNALPATIGPAMVQGPVRIELPDGSVVTSDRFMVAICACRRSQRYPL